VYIIYTTDPEVCESMLQSVFSASLKHECCYRHNELELELHAHGEGEIHNLPASCLMH